MTGSEEAQILPGSLPTGIHRHLIAAAAAGLLGDFLLYGSMPGLSLTLAFAALAAMSLLANPAALTRSRTLAPASALLAAALLPGLEHVSALSALFAVSGTAIFALMIGDRFRGTAASRVAALAGLIVIGPFRLVPDLIRLRKAASRKTARLADRLPWSVCLLPAGFPPSIWSGYWRRSTFPASGSGCSWSRLPGHSSVPGPAGSSISGPWGPKQARPRPLL